jgi:hypothetical protein
MLVVDPLLLQFLAFLAIAVLVYEARTLAAAGVSLARRSLSKPNARPGMTARPARPAPFHGRMPVVRVGGIDTQSPTALPPIKPPSTDEPPRASPSSTRRRSRQAVWLVLMAFAATAAVAGIVMIQARRRPGNTR